MKQISVIIPNYNAGRYISRCLDALLEQEYSVTEIIVIDDCSTDNSQEIIQQYKNKYDNIIFIKNSKNKGVSYSRNKGIEISKSEYIMFCDSDDWYEKDATKKMMECVEKNQADFVFTGNYITYSNGKKIEIKYNEIFSEETINKEKCIAYLPITSSAKLIKKSILIKHNLEYPEELRNCEELPVIPAAAFWAQKVMYINECLYNYYQREDSASNKEIKDLSFYDITYDKLCENIPQEQKNALNIRMVEHLLYSKNFSLIKDNFSKKEIIENIKKCKENLNGQKIYKILKNFPLRKKVFLICALLEIIFPMKLYVRLQQKLLKNLKIKDKEEKNEVKYNCTSL